ncbi:MAG: macro domain-containing protein [Deltaproteobacteria bacterium]|nr:macro domain-containing protein [Deltaproteobacteria bacterium]
MDYVDKIKIIKVDITKKQVDIIVNAANKELAGGGGVDGAIHRAAGPEMMDELKEKYKGCSVGEARKTKGYDLQAKLVYHAVGPIWRGGKNNEDELLRYAYSYCYDLMYIDNFKTIAFPAISCGVYNFPLQRAAKIVKEITLEKIKEHKQIKKVIFCLFSDKAFEIYQKTFADVLNN